MTEMESLRTQLRDAEISAALYQDALDAMTRDRSNWEETAKNNWDWYLAAQARIERLLEALDHRVEDKDPWLEIWTFGPDGIAKLKEALSTPADLSALHEDRARTLEEAAGECDKEASEYGTDTDGWHGARCCAGRMRREAAAHRARKEEK